MLDGLRIRGLRSLVDTGKIDFKPITLLLGQNSSGKSTFLRTLPLLRQSVMTRTNSPILWYGDLVDFGSFQEVISSFDGVKSVSFDFFIDELRITNPYFGAVSSPKTLSNVSLSIELQEIDDFTKLKSLTLNVSGDQLKISVDRKDLVSSIVVNDQDYTRYLPKERFYLTKADLVPQVLPGSEKERGGTYAVFSKSLYLSEPAIQSFFLSHFDRRVSGNTIRNLAKRISYFPGEEFRKKMQATRADLVSWTSVKALIPYHEGVRGIEHLRALYMIGLLPEMLYSVNQAVLNSVRDLAYVGPSRATGERYYRHQELAIDQIDPQGQNLAMFLYSLEPTRREAFSAWLEEAIGYSLRVGRRGGHVQIELKERGGESFHNLADMGYGFSQILPVMAQIWGRESRRAIPTRSKPFVAIEQPELHLHPAYQAKLADVFASSIRGKRAGGNNPTFVIETHSESLINRLGQLIYDKKIKSDDVAIYLFHRLAKTDSTGVSKAHFDNQGVLVDWPLGFFSSRSSL